VKLFPQKKLTSLKFQQKESSWEGAIRTNAIVYAPFLSNQGVIRNQLMHVSDWLPTLGRLAGFRFDSGVKLDGVDQWGMINNGGPSQKNEIVNIDDVFGFGSYIHYTMKYVNGTVNDGAYDGWLASKNNNGDIDPLQYALNVLNSTVSRAIYSVQKKNLCVDKILELRKVATISCSNSVTKNPCDLKKGPCLFDIFEDPCEENNLASTRPVIKNLLEKRYNEKKRLIVPTRRRPADPACDPKNFNFNWNWWQNDSSI
jgi:arylsulfatase B